MESLNKPTDWAVERRSDGAVLVRVPSAGSVSPRLPDAVFAFRAGDPQYTYWAQQLREQEPPAACAPRV